MAEQEAQSLQRSLEEDVAPQGDVEARQMTEETGTQPAGGNGFERTHHHRVGPLTLDPLDRVPGGHQAASTIEHMPERMNPRKMSPGAMAAVGGAALAGAAIGGWMWRQRRRRRQQPRERAMRAARQAGYVALGMADSAKEAYQHRDEYIDAARDYADAARDYADAARERYQQAQKRVQQVDWGSRYEDMRKRGETMTQRMRARAGRK